MPRYDQQSAPIAGNVRRHDLMLVYISQMPPSLLLKQCPVPGASAISRTALMAPQHIPHDSNIVCLRHVSGAYTCAGLPACLTGSLTCLQAQGGMSGGWGAGPPQWDAAQLAREQALRLYNQQLQQAQRHPQQQTHMRNANVAPQDLGKVLHLSCILRSMSHKHKLGRTTCPAENAVPLNSSKVEWQRSPPRPPMSGWHGEQRIYPPAAGCLF